MDVNVVEEAHYWNGPTGSVNIQQGRGNIKYAVEVRVSDTVYWHPALYLPSQELVIKVGQWLRLFDWPDIVFLFGGVLVKSNNVPLVITLQGMTCFLPQFSLMYVGKA